MARPTHPRHSKKGKKKKKKIYLFSDGEKLSPAPTLLFVNEKKFGGVPTSQQCRRNCVDSYTVHPRHFRPLYGKVARPIFFGQAELLHPFLDLNQEKFCFSPLEAIAQVSHKFRKAFPVPTRSAGQRKIYT